MPKEHYLVSEDSSDSCAAKTDTSAIVEKVNFTSRALTVTISTKYNLSLRDRVASCSVAVIVSDSL